MLRGIGMGLLGLLIFPALAIACIAPFALFFWLETRWEVVNWLAYLGLAIGAIALWRWAVKEEKLERIRRRFD